MISTPLSLYLKLTQGHSSSFLLESVVGGERFGRYSFVGPAFRTLVRTAGPSGRSGDQMAGGGNLRGNPLDFIASYFNSASMPLCPGACPLLRWFGRLLWLRHRSPHRTQARRRAKPGGIGTPDILLLCEELAVIDNLADRLFLIVCRPSQTRRLCLGLCGAHRATGKPN